MAGNSIKRVYSVLFFLLSGLLITSQCSDITMLQHVLAGRYKPTRYFESAPYYYGETEPVAGRVGHLPVSAGRIPKVLNDEFKFTDRDTLVRPITEAMNRYMKSTERYCAVTRNRSARMTIPRMCTSAIQMKIHLRMKMTRIPRSVI